jgi:hypothetical protein
MNVVPAQVAGVTHVVLASPPQAEFAGRVHPVILAAARLLGVDGRIDSLAAGDVDADALRGAPALLDARAGAELGDAHRRDLRGRGFPHPTDGFFERSTTSPPAARRRCVSRPPSSTTFRATTSGCRSTTSTTHSTGWTPPCGPRSKKPSVGCGS